MIINEKICISFAGGEEDAEEAIRKINPDDSVEKMLETLISYNISSNYNADFILCSNVDAPCIYEIKDKKIIKTESSWIGDKKAFDYFQECMLKEKDGIDQRISISSTNDNTLFQRAITSMEKVINSPQIDSVGGYRVSISLKENKFMYDFYMNMHLGPQNITIKQGEFHPLGHDTAANGGYTLTFIGASNDFQSVAFHIKQVDFGVVYVRNNSGLLRPEIIPDIDEVDFHDFIIREHQINPLFSTQDRYQKFRAEALAVFEKKDFANAVILFDKAINACSGAKATEMLFYKAVSLHYLKNAEAAAIFQKVINMDSKYLSTITRIINDYRSKR